jgi:hypothetical protein
MGSLYKKDLLRTHRWPTDLIREALRSPPRRVLRSPALRDEAKQRGVKSVSFLPPRLPLRGVGVWPKKTA